MPKAWDPAHDDRLREWHAAGWSDRRIAAALGVSGQRVGGRRSALGLPVNREADRARLQRWVAQLRREGRDANGFRATARGEVLARYGLPTDLRPVEVRILVVLLDGPATRTQLLARLGRKRQPRFRCPLDSRQHHRRGYIPELIARGLVASYRHDRIRGVTGSQEAALVLTATALSMFASPPPEDHTCGH